MNVTKTLTLTGPVPEVQRMLMWQQHLFYRGRAVTILATTIILFTTFSTATPVEEQESAVAVEGSLLLSLFITILLLQSLAPRWMLVSFLIPVKILQLHNHRGRLYFFLFPLLSCSIIVSEKKRGRKATKYLAYLNGLDAQEIFCQFVCEWICVNGWNILKQEANYHSICFDFLFSKFLQMLSF